MNLDGKVAVVTGAASGLGLDTCRALAAAGARVAGLDRDGDGLKRLADELGGNAVTAVADVTAEASVQAGIDAALAAFGAIHVAVSCAGIGNAAKTVSRGAPFPLDTWNKVIAVNLTGTFNLVRLAAVAMLANAPDPDTGERGVIINTASGAATQGQVGQAAYSASKAGIVGMTLPVARDLAEHGIRVVTISPGPVRDAAGGRPATARGTGHHRQEHPVPAPHGPTAGIRDAGAACGGEPVSQRHHHQPRCWRPDVSAIVAADCLDPRLCSPSAPVHESDVLVVAKLDRKCRAQVQMTAGHPSPTLVISARSAIRLNIRQAEAFDR